MEAKTCKPEAEPCEAAVGLFYGSSGDCENCAEDYMRQAYCPNFYDHAMGDCCGANDIDFDEDI